MNRENMSSCRFHKLKITQLNKGDMTVKISEIEHAERSIKYVIEELKRCLNNSSAIEGMLILDVLRMANELDIKLGNIKMALTIDESEKL